MEQLTFTLRGTRYSFSIDDVHRALQGHEPARVYQYVAVVGGNEWPVKQVLALMTGRSTTDFTSADAQRILRRLGISIRKVSDLSSLVATSRINETTPQTLPASALKRGVTVPSCITLVGCVKSKLNRPARARELYTSPYFVKMRRYAERVAGPWFILSAEHGLVSPEQRLAPYDRYLAESGTAYRQEWGSRVITQLRDRFDDLAGIRVEIHAGAPYANAIRAGLVELGAEVIEPVRGLSFGKRLSWYTRVEESFAVQAELLVARLGDRDKAVAISDLLASADEELTSPGLYSWWVDVDGARDLGTALGQRIDPGLIYVGQAGATSTNGIRSNSTLVSRIRGNHLGPSSGSSTLRRTLGSLLARASGASSINQEALTTWMHLHLRGITASLDDRRLIEAFERHVLVALDPPLNLRHMKPTTPRAALKELRHRFR